MVERLLISLLTVASSGVLVAHSVSAGPQDDKKCIFPGDCLRHGFYRPNIWGTCESRSAWRERYLSATPEQRSQMWDERGKPMDRRIFDAYDLTEGQREVCDRIRERTIAEWRRGMGEQFEEGRGLRAQLLERIGERVDMSREVIKGNASAAEMMKKQRSHREGAVERGIRERLEQINRKHPIDWSDLADRIEDALPPEQAKRGRQRLSEKFPYTISSVHGGKLGADEPATDGRASDIDRWGVYFREFTARYELADGQSNAAESILEEVRERGAQLTKNMRDDVARYQKSADEESPRHRLDVFQLDIDDLLEEFRTRLDALLTTAQKQATTTP